MNPRIYSTSNIRLLSILIAVLLIAALCLRIPLIRDRYFDPDELEHIQASFLISRGWVPYKDFFQNHTPLLHYLLVPFQLIGPSITTILLTRAFMQLFVVLILFYTYRLGVKLFSQIVGIAASAWLAINFIFLWRTLEVRPDTPAVALILAGISYMIGPDGNINKKRWWPSGLLFSLAFLLTKKTLFILIGAFIPITVYSLSHSRIKEVGKLTLAFIIPILVFLLYFLRENALGAFVYASVLKSVAWKKQFSPLLYLKPLCFFNPFLIFWSLIGLSIPLLRLYRRSSPARARFSGADSREISHYREGAGIARSGVIRAGSGEILIFFPFLAGIAGMLPAPTIYAQYFVLLLPFAALLAAYALTTFCSGLESTTRLKPGKKILAGLSLFIPLLFTAYLWFIIGYRYDIEMEDFPLWLTLSALAAIISYLLFLLSARHPVKWLIGFMIIFIIAGRPLNIMIHYRRFNNHPFIKYFSTIQGETTRDDRVMDSWTGLGIFRFPAYYYYYLPHDILLNLTPEEKRQGLLLALKRNLPQIIIDDGFLYHFPPPVREYIADHYRVREEGILGGMRIRFLTRIIHEN